MANTASLKKEYAERIVFGGNGDRQSQRYCPTIIYPVGIEENIVNRLNAKYGLFIDIFPIDNLGGTYQKALKNIIIQTLK